MNTLKLFLLAVFALTLSACGESNDNNSMTEAAENAAQTMDEEAKARAEEARERAEELEALENQ